MNLFKKIGKGLGSALKGAVKVGALAFGVVTNPLGALSGIAKSAIGAMQKVRKGADRVSAGARVALGQTAAQAEKSLLPTWAVPVGIVCVGYFMFNQSGGRRRRY